MKRLIQALGETGYWRLNLERVIQCHQVIVFNWNRTRRLVAPIVASRCCTIKHFEQIRVVVYFDKTQARFEDVLKFPHWRRAVNWLSIDMNSKQHHLQRSARREKKQLELLHLLKFESNSL